MSGLTDTVIESPTFSSAMAASLVRLVVLIVYMPPPLALTTSKPSGPFSLTTRPTTRPRCIQCHRGFAQFALRCL
jgi:hypothetical protein